jgi:hypothetical protein
MIAHIIHAFDFVFEKRAALKFKITLISEIVFSEFTPQLMSFSHV